jgi:hypothetical protein
MSIFDGTQPTLRQVPPMGPLSTMAVLKPLSTAVEAIIIPEPDPITKTSNRSIMKNLPNVEKARLPNKLFNAAIFFRVWKVFYPAFRE